MRKTTNARIELAARHFKPKWKKKATRVLPEPDPEADRERNRIRDSLDRKRNINAPCPAPYPYHNKNWDKTPLLEGK